MQTRTLANSVGVREANCTANLLAGDLIRAARLRTPELMLQKCMDVMMCARMLISPIAIVAVVVETVALVAAVTIAAAVPGGTHEG